MDAISVGLEPVARQLEELAEQVRHRATDVAARATSCDWVSPAAERMRQLAGRGEETGNRAATELLEAAAALRRHGQAAEARSIELHRLAAQAAQALEVDGLAAQVGGA